jgi:glycine/D-amino acid oxidase-like deaminating enzyme
MPGDMTERHMDAESGIETFYEATQVESPRRPRLTFDLDVDVCVVGGGIAGLTVAREVARRGWSVAVLEANRIASAASGRGRGFVRPGYAEDIDAMVERIGLDHAKELWALSEAGVEQVRKAIAESDMPGADPVDGWLDVSKTDNWRELRTRAERLRWLGSDVEAWPMERVRDELKSEHYFGALHFPRAFHIHPLNYACGMARAAETAGARIFEETPALDLDSAGVRKRIQTPAARVRAAHIVLAANVQLGSLMRRLGATLMPVTTYLLVTEALSQPVLDLAMRYRGAVSDTHRADNHYRVIGDRLMWSGKMTTWQANPRLFGRGLLRGIRNVYPQLRGVGVDYLWSATFGRTLHHMPQIGEIGRGVWVASGFGAHGLNATALAGDLIARGIIEGDQTWRLFAPYELVWAGGKLFRAVAQAMYVASRPLTTMREAWARGIERARRRSAARAEKRREKLTAHAAARAAPAPSPQPPASRPPDGKRPRGRSKTAASLPVPELLEDDARPKGN